MAAATLSARYISGRFLPDKAIDLMDEATAQVGGRGEEEEEDKGQAKQREGSTLPPQPGPA